MILLADKSVDRPIVERLRLDGHDTTYIVHALCKKVSQVSGLVYFLGGAGVNRNIPTGGMEVGVC
jgi:hypothetical protein